ncbi:uncharacterized protein BDR25DRAFT_348772 [Lindgomyces ingoldianus]|uniref:Uncharacterized protein n=1 Tax=Lindgomyces ingoldianus TaxID=673940 RepID=A0ACB6RCC7_9PLEO|nr:uncharacterized protein BDR25DRAFT_348772 [Lindgomyces ingoldianus]KAF2476836.1 hypothetical protein BDR25DRAFT_348772 [Lindgomyces ingoldianus]
MRTTDRNIHRAYQFRPIGPYNPQRARLFLFLPVQIKPLDGVLGTLLGILVLALVILMGHPGTQGEEGLAGYEEFMSCEATNGVSMPNLIHKFSAKRFKIVARVSSLDDLLRTRRTQPGNGTITPFMGQNTTKYRYSRCCKHGCFQNSFSYAEAPLEQEPEENDEFPSKRDETSKLLTQNGTAISVNNCPHFVASALQGRLGYSPEEMVGSYKCKSTTICTLTTFRAMRKIRNLTNTHTKTTIYSTLKTTRAMKTPRNLVITEPLSPSRFRNSLCMTKLNCGHIKFIQSWESRHSQPKINGTNGYNSHLISTWSASLVEGLPQQPPIAASLPRYDTSLSMMLDIANALSPNPTEQLGWKRQGPRKIDRGRHGKRVRKELGADLEEEMLMLLSPQK